jgi:hypothetical protein
VSRGVFKCIFICIIGSILTGFINYRTSVSVEPDVGIFMFSLYFTQIRASSKKLGRQIEDP